MQGVGAAVGIVREEVALAHLADAGPPRSRALEGLGQVGDVEPGDEPPLARLVLSVMHRERGASAGREPDRVVVRTL